MSRKYYITEVFSEQPYGGNQLATVVDVDGLTSEEMQQIARAFNFAETTFVLGGTFEAGFDVRIFTPAAELPFAGHPTLGTSYLLKHIINQANVETVTLNLGVGPITVTFDDDVLWMRQIEPEFLGVVSHDQVAQGLGLSAEMVDKNYPCQRVSTGIEFLMVPLVSYDALQQAAWVSSDLADACFVFCRGGYTDAQSIQARMFADALGVAEDPATGSANGCLAAYLAEHQYFGSSAVELSVGQGYEVNRPSELQLRSSKRPGEFVVEVGGKVRLVSEGQWLL